MNIWKRIQIVVITGMIVFGGLYLGEQFSIPGVPSVISDAEAVVGRPTLHQLALPALRAAHRDDNK